jgi:hypothetical protein
VKVGDLVRHRQHKASRYAHWKDVHLVSWTDGEHAFQALGDHRNFYPMSDYEVISEAR